MIEIIKKERPDCILPNLGGQSGLNLTSELAKAGAKEVHVRVACPPLMYPCDFGISTRSYEELLARQFIPVGYIESMDDLISLEAKVADRIGADSVKYNSLDLFVEALGIPRDDLCLKCWNGVKPNEA